MIHFGQGSRTPDKKPEFRKRTIHKYQKGSVLYLDKNNNYDETQELSQSERKESTTPFDTTYRTLVTKMSKTLIPLVNEMFSLDISENAEVVKVNDIRDLSQRVARALIKTPEFREEVTTVGQGELYELPSEKIRAAEAKAEQAIAKAEAEKKQAIAKAEEKVRILTERLIKYGEDPAA